MIHCLPVTHVVGPNLHGTTVHFIQLYHIRGIRAHRVTIHLNIRDTLSPPAVLTGNATDVAAPGTLQENEYNHTDEKYEGQHRRRYQDNKPCIVHYSSLYARDVRNTSISYHQHFGRSLRFNWRDGRQRDSLAFGSDA